MSRGDQVLVLLGKEKKNHLTFSLHVAIKMFSLEWAWLHVGYLTGKGSKEMDEKVPQFKLLSFLRLFLRMQNGSYGMSGDLKPSFLHSFSRSDVNKRPLTDLHVTLLSV